MRKYYNVLLAAHFLHNFYICNNRHMFIRIDDEWMCRFAAMRDNLEISADAWNLERVFEAIVDKECELCE